MIRVFWTLVLSKIIIGKFLKTKLCKRLTESLFVRILTCKLLTVYYRLNREIPTIRRKSRLRFVLSPVKKIFKACGDS